MKKYIFSLLLLSFFTLSAASAQWYSPDFWAEIQAFKKQDAKVRPPQQAILFVGSSSIRLWKNLDESFSEHRVLNRGFGGSTLRDLKRYLPDIVYPYRPRQIVIYSGENDLASGRVNAQQLLQRFKDMFVAIRKRMPQVSIVYISMKPSPSREHLMPVMSGANSLIQEYLLSKANTQFIDVYSPMLDANGKPNSELFVEDMLHMNPRGYQIWQQAIAPHLIKE